MSVYHAIKKGVRDALNGLTVSVDLAELEAVGILDASDVRINPATKENQESLLSRIPSDLTPSGNFRASIEETAIMMPVDIQAHLNEHSSQTISSPSASTTYTTNTVDTSLASCVTFYIIADQPLDIVVQVSFDGTTFYDLAGTDIASADFDTSKANFIHVVARAPYMRLKIITGSTPPTNIKVHWVVGR